MQEARSRLPEFMEAKRRKEEEERLAKEAEDRAKEDDRKRANILTKQRADEELNVSIGIFVFTQPRSGLALTLCLNLINYYFINC